uniref:Uncharacterized protein n=1 Tax=Romanomermis culicivorax TaxID=13658 RepID=A0A915J4Y8_ROMCU
MATRGKLIYANLLMYLIAAVLVGIEKYRDQMLQTFEEMKKADGSYLSYYLNIVVCSEAPTRKCSLDNYYKSTNIQWQNIELREGTQKPTLNALRQTILDSMKEQVNNGEKQLLIGAKSSVGCIDRCIFPTKGME